MQLINFLLIPLEFRVVFVNMVALGWTAFLSTLNSRSSIPLSPEAQVEAPAEYMKLTPE